MSKRALEPPAAVVNNITHCDIGTINNNNAAPAAAPAAEAPVDVTDAAATVTG